MSSRNVKRREALAGNLGTRTRPIFLMFYALAVLLFSGQGAYAAICSNGPRVKDSSYCRFFVQYVSPKDSIPDKRIVERFPTPEAGDPPIRSIALLVDVNQYPKLPTASERELKPAKIDLQKFSEFLRTQDFDEIIVLENQDATRDTIDYFLENYIDTDLNVYGKRARVLFAFSGHGVGQDKEAGSLVLSGYSGDGDYANLYPLGSLTPKLQHLASKSYQFLALIGSCFSGGAIPPSPPDVDFFFPGAPGAHAMTATRTDALAFAVGDGKGSLFFDKLIEGVNTCSADRDYCGWVQIGNTLKLEGGGIVRLGALAASISGELDRLTVDPAVSALYPGLKKYPQIRLGALEAGPEWGGAFFFLGPPKKQDLISQAAAVSAPTAVSVCNATTSDCSIEDSPVEVTALGLTNTGSSVLGHPDIAIFNSPDSYKIAGVDISHWDGDIDWVKLAGRRTRIKFAYVKASEGGKFKDPQFDKNWAGSRQSGLIHGAYHVLNFCSTADAQFKMITGTVPRENDSLPIAIDMEWDGAPRALGQRECNDIPKIRATLLDLLRRLEKQYGKIPVIHAPAAGIGAILNGDFARYPIWLEYFQKSTTYDKDLQYQLTGPRLPGTNPWTIWQVSSNGRSAGAKSPIDIDVFFGNTERFNKFADSGRNEGRIAAISITK
jgi:GH25 family lysozyme M1 (1,4-beta-N-acetylmuramidase)